MKFSKEDIETAKNIILQFNKKKSIKEIFYNLCFCVLVPQTRFSTVSSAIKVLQENNFYEKSFSRDEILEFIKHVRFKNRKSVYLLEIKNKSSVFWTTLLTLRESVWAPLAKRKWLIGDIKGMGMKSASHFLRNLGEVDLAIVDTHILKYFKIKDKKFVYLDIENRMKVKAKKLNISIAVLDALIWKLYSKTSWDKFIY